MAKEKNRSAIGKILIFLLAIGIAIPITILIIKNVAPKKNLLYPQSAMFEINEWSSSHSNLNSSIDMFLSYETENSSDLNVYSENDKATLIFFKELHAFNKNLNAEIVNSLYFVKDVDGIDEKIKKFENEYSEFMKKGSSLDAFYVDQLSAYSSVENKTPAKTKNYFNSFIKPLTEYELTYINLLNTAIDISNNCTESMISNNQLRKAYRLISIKYATSLNQYLKTTLNEGKVLNSEIVSNFNIFKNKNYLSDNYSNKYYDNRDASVKVIEAINFNQMPTFIEKFLIEKDEEFENTFTGGDKVKISNLRKILLGQEV